MTQLKNCITEVQLNYIHVCQNQHKLSNQHKKQTFLELNEEKKWRMKTKKRKKDNWQKENVHKGKHSPRDAVITCSVQATTASVSPTETLIKSHASSETEHENSTSPSSPEMYPISLPVAPTVVLYFSQLGTLALHRCRNLMADRTKRRLNHGCAVTRAITLRMSHCSEANANKACSTLSSI